MHRLISLIFIAFPLLHASELPAVDGWMNSNAVWTLYQSTPSAVLAVRLLVPAEVGTNTVQAVIDGAAIPAQSFSPGEHEFRYAVVGATGERTVSLTWNQTKALPAPDNRLVSARILRIALDPVQAVPSQWSPHADIALPGGPIGLGAGWQPLETWQLVLVSASAGSPEHTGTLTLDAQPGAGTSGKPTQVQVLDNAGNLVDKIEIDKRMRIDLLITTKAMAAQPLSLIVVNGGSTTNEDPRKLDLQVFSLSWAP
jgi:hypothetical protein